MSWFKVDDGFGLHPKVLAAGNSAVGGWVRAGSWCAQHNTDGHVPAAMLSVLGMRKRDADALVETGLWHRNGADYVFHDWEKYQPSREQVESEREATRRRQQEWRDRQRDIRERNGVTNGVTNAVTNGAPTRPDPTRPVVPTELQTPPTGEVPPASAKPRKRKHPLPEGWMPSAESVAKIAEDCPGLDSRRATVQFVDYWRGAGTPKIEWDSVWRNWMRREYETRGRAGNDRETQRKHDIFAAALERGEQQERANIYRLEIGQ